MGWLYAYWHWFNVSCIGCNCKSVCIRVQPPVSIIQAATNK